MAGAQKKGSQAKQFVKKQAKRKLILAILGWVGVPGILLLMIALIVVFVLGVGIFAGFGGGAGGAQASNVSQCLATDSEGGATDSEGGSTGSPTVEIKDGQLGDPLDPENMNQSSPFGAREEGFHDGMDFAAPEGTPIYAIADGTVTASGTADGYGHWIRIKHDLDGETIESLYGHMPGDSLAVEEGEEVKAGTQIAEVGDEGFSTGAHLHLGIYVGEWAQGEGVDPAPWLEKARDHSPSTVEGGTDDHNADDDTGDTSSDDEGASEDDERAAAGDTDVETTRNGSLNAPQQANIAAIISGAKNSDLDDEDQQRRGSEIATSVAGMQSNFLSVNNEDDPNRVGIFGLAPFGDVTRDQLANPKRAAEAFFDRLVDTYEDDSWMDQPTGDVVAKVYPSLTAVKDDVATWDDMSRSAVEQLWDSSDARQSATPDKELTQNTEGDPCQPEGSGEAGGELAPGSVPEEFVKWINLGAEMCDGVTPAILAAQISQESSFQQHDANSAGAQGYTQFVGDTWNTYGFEVDESGKEVGEAGGGDPNDVADAVMAQARYNCHNVEIIRDAQDSGSVSKDEDMSRMMLAAYQGGPGSVLDAGGMPNNSDGGMTQTEYADSIIEASKEFGGDEDQVSSDGESSGGSQSGSADELRNVDVGGGSEDGRKVVEAAAGEVGTWYAWGGGDKNGPTKGTRDGGYGDANGDYDKVGYDCSGLTTFAAWQGAGVEIPKGTSQQTASDKLESVSMNDLKPGDFIYTPGHVSIYAGVDKESGEQMIVEAQMSGTKVHVVPLNTPDGDAYRLKS